MERLASRIMKMVFPLLILFMLGMLLYFMVTRSSSVIKGLVRIMEKVVGL